MSDPPQPQPEQSAVGNSLACTPDTDSGALLEPADVSCALPASASQDHQAKDAPQSSSEPVFQPVDKPTTDKTPAACPGADVLPEPCPSQPLGTLFLELFAGTGRMSKAFTRLGLQVLAIDSVKVSGVSSVVLDLVKPLSQKLVFDLIRSRRLAAVHLAPPCGTSSAARRIDAGPGSPQPLRSALHPDGLPGLSFFNRQRVATANKLYRFSAEVILACQANGVLWSLENPESSLFWLDQSRVFSLEGASQAHLLRHF